MAWRFRPHPNDGIAGAVLADPTDLRTPFRYWKYTYLEKVKTPAGCVLPNGMPATTARAITQYDWDAVDEQEFRRTPWELMCPTGGDPSAPSSKIFYFMYKVKFGATKEYVTFLCRHLNDIAEAALQIDTFQYFYPIVLSRFPGHLIKPRHLVAMGEEPEKVMEQDEWKEIYLSNQKAVREAILDERAKRFLPAAPSYRPFRHGNYML